LRQSAFRGLNRLPLRSERGIVRQRPRHQVGFGQSVLWINEATRWRVYVLRS